MSENNIDPNPDDKVLYPIPDELKRKMVLISTTHFAEVFEFPKDLEVTLWDIHGCRPPVKIPVHLLPTSQVKKIVSAMTKALLKYYAPTKDTQGKIRKQKQARAREKESVAQLRAATEQIKREAIAENAAENAANPPA